MAKIHLVHQLKNIRKLRVDHYHPFKLSLKVVQLKLFSKEIERNYLELILISQIHKNINDKNFNEAYRLVLIFEKVFQIKLNILTVN